MVETDVTTIKLTGLAPNTQVRADTLLWYLMIILMKANVMMNMIITWLINDRTESTMAMMISYLSPSMPSTPLQYLPPLPIQPCPVRCKDIPVIIMLVIDTHRVIMSC